MIPVGKSVVFDEVDHKPTWNKTAKTSGCGVINTRVSLAVNVIRWIEAMYFTVMYLFSVSTSAPSQTSCQIVACAKRKYTHRGVPVQVGLIWSRRTNIPTWCETWPTQDNKPTDLQRKHQIHFAAPLVTLQVNINVELYSLFQETHFALWLLPLFVLIDKKLRQFLRDWTRKTSSRPNRGGQVIFFPPQMMTNMLFSNSHYQTISSRWNTQAPT